MTHNKLDLGLYDKTVLITGGTGTFGQNFAKTIAGEAKKVIIYSRDEFKQHLMQKEFTSPKMRYFIGDVRDKERLTRAFEGVDVVVHAAAMKQVPACEYNPIEAIKTNIEGARNIIDAALDTGVKRVVALSTDKACSPVNLYGATKLVSDKLFIQANSYSGTHRTVFSVVRYGNISNSRGSVIPFFKSIKEGPLPVTDSRMTRFWVSIDQAVDLVKTAIREAKGGEIYVVKSPSYNIADIVVAMDREMTTTGIRPGEKLHEALISKEDSMTTYEYKTHFVIYPQMSFWNQEIEPEGEKVVDGFNYTSEENEFLHIDNLTDLLEKL